MAVDPARFFKRSEPIAWAIVDQWLSLLVQSVVIALVQGMTLALYLTAKSGSPLVTMAVSTAALVFMVTLVVVASKRYGVRSIEVSGKFLHFTTMRSGS